MKKCFNTVMIIGVGRSGTSLLQSMLHAHPRIEFLVETKFLREYVFRNENKGPLDHGDRMNLIDRLRYDEKFNRTKVDPETIINDSGDCREVYFKLLQSVQNENTEYIGDKDPRFLDFLPHLHRLLPKAKIIHIIRDPRDVVLSRTKADWSKHWPFFMHCFMYRAQLERGRRQGKALYRANYYEIYYEELITNPRCALKGVSDFLNLTYTDEMLNFGSSAKALVAQKEMQWKKETLGPLLSDNKEKWRGAFTSEQLYIVQRICKQTFKVHPYQKVAVHVSFMTKLQVGFMTLLSRVFAFLYPLRIKYIK